MIDMLANAKNNTLMKKHMKGRDQFHLQPGNKH